MNKLLAPGMALLDRFTYPVKFLILGVFALIPIVFMTILGLKPLVHDLRQAELEKMGSDYVQAALPLLASVQRHRGRTSGYLSGDDAAKAKMEEEAAKVNAAIQALEAMDKETGGAEEQVKQLAAIKAKWAETQQNAHGRAFTPKESFAAHTVITGDILEYMEDMAHSYELIFDPTPENFFLQDAAVVQAPDLTEGLGKLRAKMTGILTRKSATAEEKAEVLALIGEISLLGKTVDSRISHVIAARPDLKEVLSQELDALRPAIKKLVALSQQELGGGEFTVSGPDYFKESTAVIDMALKMADADLAQLERLLDARVAKDRKALYGTSLAVFALLAILAYLTTAMRACIIRAVRVVNDGTAKMAAGDFTQPIVLQSRDEMGEIAADVNRARMALAKLIAEARDMAEEVARDAQGLAGGAKEIAQAASHQSDAVSSSAAAVEELTVAITHVADQTEETNRTANQASSLAENGRRVADRASSSMTAVAESVTSTAQQIEGLNTRAAEISGIVQVIKDIADQTNLLALNAAIEAARAGEQGRGFAVVADEVRKLAERTAGATTEIGAMIEAIQHETKNAVSSMEGNSRKAEEGRTIVAEVSSSLSEIMAAAQTVLDRVEEITGASREQKAASTDIAQSIENIAQMTEENSASAGQVSDAAGHLGNLADKLKTELERFHV